MWLMVTKSLVWQYSWNSSLPQSHHLQVPLLLLSTPWRIRTLHQAKQVDPSSPPRCLTAATPLGASRPCPWWVTSSTTQYELATSPAPLTQCELTSESSLGHHHSLPLPSLRDVGIHMPCHIIGLQQWQQDARIDRRLAYQPQGRRINKACISKGGAHINCKAGISTRGQWEGCINSGEGVSTGRQVYQQRAGGGYIWRRPGQAQGDQGRYWLRHRGVSSMLDPTLSLTLCPELTRGSVSPTCCLAGPIPSPVHLY